MDNFTTQMVFDAAILVISVKPYIGCYYKVRYNSAALELVQCIRLN